MRGGFRKRNLVKLVFFAAMCVFGLLMVWGIAWIVGRAFQPPGNQSAPPPTPVVTAAAVVDDHHLLVSIE